MVGDTVTQIPIRRALISVYDKTGLEELACGLHAAGVEIVSTGNTAARITAAGVRALKQAQSGEESEEAPLAAWQQAKPQAVS